MIILIMVFQNLADSGSKACFCGGLGNFYETLPSVKALLCEAQGYNNHEGSKQWFGGWWDVSESKPSTITPSSQSSAASQVTTADVVSPDTLSANRETVSDVSTKVSAIITGSSERHRRRAAATTCADFINLVIKCKFKRCSGISYHHKTYSCC